MKLDVSYSDQDVETLDIKKTVKFGFDENAQQMIFKMFSKNIYSNPIGSVVREITSNCFDSHIEANVLEPVVLKLTNENNQYYISFIDVGVGISPERMATQYASAFSSTKRNDNHQIGGFGVGSLSLMAYAESYFLSTIHNGIEYLYNIRKGTGQPEADLLSKKKTTKRNGTTVKLPVKSNDVHVFEREILRQLYYFENIIFEGFSHTVKNNYQIIEGKNFLYRGRDQNQYAHICLGRVAYPIDFTVLDDNLSGDFYAGEWQIPVAIKLNIGDVNVTVSREAIDYTEATKKLIKKKLLAIKAELNAMLDVQHAKLNSLAEYYRLEGNAAMLILSKDEMIDISCLREYKKVVFEKYNALNVPVRGEVITDFYLVSMLGKKGRRDHTWDKSLKTVATENVLFLSDGEDMPRKKNAYLKKTHKHFYAIRRHKLTIGQLKTLVKRLTNNNITVDNKIVFKQFRELQKEVYALVECNVKKYASITVPDGFKVISNTYDPNYEIPVSYNSKYGFTKERIKMSALQTSKATLYYSDITNEDQMEIYKKTYEALFKPEDESMFRLVYNDYRGYPIRFIMVSKSNLKYIKELKNAKPIIEFEKVLMRKRDVVMKQIERNMFLNRFNDQNELFLNHKLFGVVDTDYAKKLIKLKALYKKYYAVKTHDITVDENSLLLKFMKIDYSRINYNGHELFAAVEKTSEKNSMLGYVRIDDDFDPNNKDYTEKEITDILKLIKLVYVK
jgi:hypothetical protein